MTTRSLMPLLSCLALSACANQMSISRQERLPATNPDGKEGGTVVMIDAKQRVIYTAWKDGIVNGKPDRVPVYCAEPSPDALATLAVSSGLTLSAKDVADAAVNGSTNEQAADIGLRTQSIQLMRDIMFRECEAYVSGANKDVGFMTEHRRLQSSMVAVLAIEQLTGAVKTSQPTLTAAKSTDDSGGGGKDDKKDKSGASDATDPKKKKKAATDDLSTAAQALATQQKAERVAAKAAADAPGDATKQKTLKDQQDKTDAAAKKVKTAATNAKKTDPATDDTDQKPKASDSMAYVAPAVEDIAIQAMSLSFTRELCISVLEEQVSRPRFEVEKSAGGQITKELTDPDQFKTAVDDKPTTIRQACFDYLANTVDAYKNDQASRTACLRLVSITLDRVGKAGATGLTQAQATDYLNRAGCSATSNPPSLFMKPLSQRPDLTE